MLVALIVFVLGPRKPVADSAWALRARLEAADLVLLVMFAAAFRAFVNARLIASRGVLIGSPRRFRATSGWLPLAAAGSVALSGLWSLVGGTAERFLSPGHSSETYNSLPAHPSAATVVAAAILIVALGPIVEEIIFRGSFQSFLGRWMPRGIALVLVAALFGAVHGMGAHGYDLASEIEVGTAGVWYGLLFELSGSLLPAIVAHATWNAIALSQELTGGDAGLPLLLSGVLASAALMVRNGSQLVSA